MANDDKRSENLQLVTDFYDLVNRNDMDGVSDHIARNIALRSLPTQQKIKGRKDVLEYVRDLKTAFPDLKLKLSRQVVGTTYVVSEYTASGTHRGTFHSPLGNVLPTGRSINVPICEVLEVHSGKIVSARQYYDSATLLNQLGAI